MSPHEMSAVRVEFDAACAALGWSKKEVEIHHERDDCSWFETVWLGPTNGRLFSESHLEQGMVREIIRLASSKGDGMQTFEFEGKNYVFDAKECYDSGGLVLLPDGRVLWVENWLDVVPPRAYGFVEKKMVSAKEQ